jgi:antirestriction protein
VTYENATEYIDTAISQLDSKDYDGIEKSCTSLSNYWDKMYPYLTAMSEHDMLDEASITINSLCDMSKNKSDELENELITAKNQIKSIYDNQRITFGNIF